MKKERKTFQTIKKISVFYMARKKLFYISILLSLIAGITSTVAIYYTGQVYDHFLGIEKKSDENFLRIIVTICVGLFICYIIGNLFQWLLNYLILIFSEEATYNMRKGVFKNVQSYPIKFFDQNASGEVMSRVGNDVDNIGQVVFENLGNAIYWIFMIISMLILMFLINPVLALITLIVIPIMTLINAFIFKKIRPYYAKQQKYMGKLNAFTEEAISGLKIISLFKMQEKKSQEFKKINDELTRNSVIASATGNIVMPINAFMNNLSFVTLAALGISFVAMGYISKDWGISKYESAASLLIVFTLFARSITMPINQLISTFNFFMLAIASSERINEVLEHDPEKDNETAQNIVNIVGKVEAKNMSFQYTENKKILQNVSFVAKANTTTAIVGPTGAGKTTIVNLLTKFYDINSGQLLIDDVSISEIKRESLRKNITMVLQDTFLFGVSVKENIRYGKMNATDKEIKEAAIIANAHNFILQLPKGYDTILEENASNLSQGQKQLIAIARAFLANSKIVILDEATSSIDTNTELQIQAAMKKLMKNRTSFVIAHRLSTIKNADNILVINQGKIVESGKHKNLISKKGFYAKLYNSQFKNIAI